MPVPELTRYYATHGDAVRACEQLMILGRCVSDIRRSGLGPRGPRVVSVHAAAEEPPGEGSGGERLRIRRGAARHHWILV
ncbi:MAG: hypothetical protein ABWZ30_01730, partial [Jiangellaceae bacterium]